MMFKSTSCFGLALCLCASSPSAGAVDEELYERVEMLAASDATQLALRVLDDEQPPVERIEDWQRAEQLRFSIFQRRQDWEALAERLDSIPPELPLIYQHRLVNRAVGLLLQSGEGERSRRYLRELVWRGSGDSTQVAQWRRQIILSYLLDGLLDDARIAMSRYQTEYAPTDQNWSYLYGLTLLKSALFERASARLSLVHNDGARALMWLARLRAGTDDPLAIIDQADALYSRIRKGKDQPVVAQRIWALQAEAAAAAGDLKRRVEALEKLFSRPLRPDVEHPVEYSPDDLWQAYEALGRDFGNRNNLLLGDTDAWLARAAELKSGDSYDARAVHALMAAEAKGAEQTNVRHGELYDLLRGADMEHLAISLYTDSVRFQRTEDIPHAVRHRIVQHAMRERDLELAAAMARDLTTTHAEQSADEWTLVRARLAIYSGDVSAGEVLLERLIISKEALDKNMSDRVLQLVFDLQGVDRHAQALHLFRLIQQRAQSEIIQREIHFWIGESLESLGEHERAAESFIRSSLHGGNHRDVWGQTSRFHAAEALADAGLIEDARAVYRGLLDEVTDRGQMIALDKKLQDLWMRDQGREGSQIENIE